MNRPGLTGYQKTSEPIFKICQPAELNAELNAELKGKTKLENNGGERK